MTPQQLEEWYAYYCLEPWDTRTQLALVCETIDRKITEIGCTLTKTAYDTKYHGKLTDYQLGITDDGCDR